MPFFSLYVDNIHLFINSAQSLVYRTSSMCQAGEEAWGLPIFKMFPICVSKEQHRIKLFLSSLI